MPMLPRWECLPFDALGGSAVYALLRLRAQVFVVEQACAYEDPDGLDTKALHLMAWRNDELVAYARCLPPGAVFRDSAIGRIVVAPGRRGGDLGGDLVRRAIAVNRERWPRHNVRINAQSALEDYYAALGFVACGEPFLEDDIPHVHMLLDAG
jgi:ElaA protein